MKKLMIALAAAATTMFSFGDVTLPTGTSFEALTEGPVTVGDIVGKDDTGNQDGANKFWYSAAPETDELGAITNDVASGVSRPDMFLNSTQSKSLFIETSDKQQLVRTALPNSSGVQPVAIGDNGIYLDTLVKFTAADGAFTESLTDGDKIAIEYVEHESEGEGDEGYTNFVVRAGLIGATLGQTNYYAHISGDPTFANFNKDVWHRLTVRTIADVGDGHVGFVIYLDGDVNKTLEYPTTVDAGFNTASLDPAAEVYYNNEKHALFPSAIEALATGGSTISSVAFSGNGFIDDVSFATEAPQFIKDGEAVVVPFVADAGVTAISVSVAGVADPISVVNGVATLPAQTTAFTVTATIDTDGDYEFVSMTVGESVYDTNPASVTGYTGGDITITTIRNNFNLFDANGDPIQGTFQKLSEVLETEGVAKIVLAHNYDVAESEGGGFVTYNIDNDITLNLNGNTITAVDTQEEVLFTVNAGTTLVVIDSVGGGTIDYDTEYGVFGGEGDTVVGATSGDFGPTIIGPLLDKEEDPFVQVVRAKLDGEGNSDTEDSFAFKDYIAKGSDVSDELVGGYWVVTPQGGSDTPVAVPTAETGLVYDGTEKIGVVVGTGYTLTGNIATNAGNYTATATLVAGYVWSDTTTEAKSINWSIAPKTDAAVVVTLTSEIAEYSAQLEFPTASATIGGNDVAGTPAWDPATITEPEAGATNTYTVTFTVTTANYVGSFGTATFKVWKAESEEPVYPSYIDNITDPEKKAAYEAKYSTWATTYSVADGAGNEEAFLLNCAPANVETAKANFKIPSITVDAQGNVTVGTIEGTFNGKLQLKGSTDLSTWTNLNAASKDYNFFKYELTY